MFVPWFIRLPPIVVAWPVRLLVMFVPWFIRLPPIAVAWPVRLLVMFVPWTKFDPIVVACPVTLLKIELVWLLRLFDMLEPNVVIDDAWPVKLPTIFDPTLFKPSKPEVSDPIEVTLSVIFLIPGILVAFVPKLLINI